MRILRFAREFGETAALRLGLEKSRGDIILTGTPHGVGPVQSGDRLVGTIDGLPELKVTIGEAAA